MRSAISTLATLSIAGITIGISIPAAEAAATPQVNCVQNPGTNSDLPGTFIGTNINIRTGPFVSCTSIGEGEPANDSLAVRCTQVNSNGVEWVYLTDYVSRKTGWSEAKFVFWSGTLATC